MSWIRQSLCAQLLSCSSLLIIAGQGQGAWESTPEVRIGVEANDNPRLRAEEDNSGVAAIEPASRLIGEVGLSLANYGERHDLNVAGMVRRDDYLEAVNADLASTDVYLNADGQHLWPRAELGFSADLARERILGTEALDVDAVDIDDTVIEDALLGFNERRFRALFSPYTEFRVGERSAARLDLRLMDVSYDDPLALSNRTDFTDSEVGAEYIRTLSRRSELAGRVFASRYEAVANRNTTESVGIEMRFSRDLSSVWSVNATWGIERSEWAYFDETDLRVSGEEDDFIFGVGIRKRAETSSLDFTVRRRVLPDSFGFRVARSELIARLLRDLSPRVTGGLILRLVGNEPLVGVVDLERDYGRLELNIEWAFAELWSLVAGYEHASWRSTDALERSAHSNVVSVGFNYSGRSRRPQSL